MVDTPSKVKTAQGNNHRKTILIKDDNRLVMLQTQMSSLETLSGKLYRNRR